MFLPYRPSFLSRIPGPRQWPICLLSRISYGWKCTEVWLLPLSILILHLLMLWVSICHCFVLLNSNLLYKYTTICSFIFSPSFLSPPLSSLLPACLPSNHLSNSPLYQSFISSLPVKMNLLVKCSSQHLYLIAKALVTTWTSAYKERIT